MRDTRSQLKRILCEANDSEKKADVIDQRSFPTLSFTLSKFFYIFGKTQFYGHAGASKHTTRNVYGRELIKHSGVTRFCDGFDRKTLFCLLAQRCRQQLSIDIAYNIHDMHDDDKAEHRKEL